MVRMLMQVTVHQRLKSFSRRQINVCPYKVVELPSMIDFIETVAAPKYGKQISYLNIY